MICLSCGGTLEGSAPQECPECGEDHEARPPVVGINHVSQMLVALDRVREGELTAEEFEEIFQRFYDLFSQFEEKWQLQENSLVEQLSSNLKQSFGDIVATMDDAVREGYQGVELIESALAEGTDTIDEADACLTLFFKKTCGAAAKLFEELEQLKRKSGQSGAFFNLPQV